MKFASQFFLERSNLDLQHRTLLNDFSLPPGTARFDNGIALCLLPYYEEGFALSFIFPSTDHGGRPNTSSIVCIIPLQLISSMSINEVIQCIWEKNNLAGIAKQNSEIRPDTLLMDVKTTTSSLSPVFSSDIKWPSHDTGYLQINGALKILTRKEKIAEPEKKAFKKKFLYMFIPAAVIAVIIALNLHSEEKSPKTVDTHKIISISNDKFNQNLEQAQETLQQKAENNKFTANSKEKKPAAKHHVLTISVKNANEFKEILKPLIRRETLPNKKKIQLQLHYDADIKKQPLSDYISMFEKAKVLELDNRDNNGTKITLYLPRTAKSSDLLDYKYLDSFLSQFMEGEKDNDRE